MANTNKLYVGNLDYDMRGDDLKQLFEQVGDVEEAVVIEDRQSGRSRGFGFVTMASEELAQEAIEKLNEQEVSGRKIIVNEAKPKK